MTGRSLSKGMKVMLNVEVVYHELYGCSLNVRDIDPTYTVGDLERKRREILGQLEEEGIINMNRELEFPLLPKTIAVISSPTAAGFGDFMNQLERNPYGFRFHVKLFPAIMQGDKATESVIAALDRIYAYENLFDVVVIIRGGGSQTDLGCFDSYDMAANVAQFPLPVIAGIGHERDETIVDRVAHLRVKTPTAAAAYLIELFQEQESGLVALRHDFMTGIQDVLSQERNRQLLVVSEFKRSVQIVLSGNVTRMKLLFRHVEHASEIYIRNRLYYFEQLKNRLNSKIALLSEKQKSRIQLVSGVVRQRIQHILTAYGRRLDLAENTVKLADPGKVLARGYSITRLNGKAIKNAVVLKSGDCLETELAEGIVKSEVK